MACPARVLTWLLSLVDPSSDGSTNRPEKNSNVLQNPSSPARDAGVSRSPRARPERFRGLHRTVTARGLSAQPKLQSYAL